MIIIEELVQHDHFENIEFDKIRETLKDSIDLCFRPGKKTVLTITVDFKIEISFT